MVVTKHPGVVPCAHCKQQPGSEDCQVCTKVVCQDCGARWQSCDQVVARELRLGMGQRLIDVDKDGHYGVVQHMLSRKRRLFDLRRTAYVALYEALPHGSIVSGQRFARIEPEPVSTSAHQDTGFTTTLTIASLMSVSRVHIVEVNQAPPQGFSLATKDSAACVTLADQTVRLVSVKHGQTTRHVPLPGKVIQASALDDAAGLLFTATFGYAQLDHIDDTLASDKIGRLRIWDGDAYWVGVGKQAAATITRSSINVGTLGHIEAWQTEPPFERIAHIKLRASGDSAFRWTEPDSVALSDDGRFLAYALNRYQVMVNDLVSGDTTLFSGHTDPVNLVRFAANDTLLITADRDNRVFIRPRVGDTFVDRSVAVRLAEDPVDLAPLASDDDVS